MSTRIKALLVRGERGATAVIVAFSIVLLFGAGAVGFDIAQLVNARQQVRGAIDAAAQAAAVDLPGSPSDAIAHANQIAHANYSEIPDGGLTIKFYCVVKNKSGVPDESQIPSTCNPGTKGLDWTVASSICTSSAVCAIPVDPSKTSVKANTLTISYSLKVDYVFGPAINIDYGYTGDQSTASCNGLCGGESPANPMDVVVMADRTPSMSSNLTDLKTGLKEMLKVMNPKQQYLALGTIAQSVTKKGCLTGTQTIRPTGQNPFPGTWVPVAFSNDYATVDSNGVSTPVQSSSFWKSADCLAQDGSTGWNTHLSAALKGAGRYLYGNQFAGSSNNLASLPDRTIYGTPKKVIIFETDGSPVEGVYRDSASDLSLNTTSDPGNKNTQSACANLQTVANEIKSQPNSVIITIGFGSAASSASKSCGQSIGTVGDLLASVASGGAVNDGCYSPAKIANENGDGDNYFCAATAEELKEVFAAAAGQATKSTKFMKIPGISD
jgi:hypothetical protein